MEKSNPRIEQAYKTDVVPKLVEKFKYSNANQVPAIKKIVVSMGVGRQAVINSKAIDNAVNDLTLITGQKPVIRRAKKSIANFKLREGMPVGVCVTLRRQRMFEFIDRLVNVALPRVRDFKGIPRRSFDGKGNYSLGITEQIIFPEIDIEKSTAAGLNITFVTTAQSNEEGLALLEGMGFPFRA